MGSASVLTAGATFSAVLGLLYPDDGIEADLRGVSVSGSASAAWASKGSMMRTLLLEVGEAGATESSRLMSSRFPMEEGEPPADSEDENGDTRFLATCACAASATCACAASASALKEPGIADDELAQLGRLYRAALASKDPCLSGNVASRSCVLPCSGLKEHARRGHEAIDA